MVKGQEVFKCIDPKANFIAQFRNEYVFWYEKRPNINYPNGSWNRCVQDNAGYLGKVQIEEFADKDWQDCILEKEQDPKELIGCLCWFWDNESERPIITTLAEINTNGERHFLASNNFAYRYCRPVKKTEVKFFEGIE